MEYLPKMQGCSKKRLSSKRAEEMLQRVLSDEITQWTDEYVKWIRGLAERRRQVLDESDVVENLVRDNSAPATAGQALATCAAWVQLVTVSFFFCVFIFSSDPRYCSLGVLFLYLWI